MNKVILMGRLTRDPDVRYSTGDNAITVARYTLAVERRHRTNDLEQTADFIPCVAFGKSAEFVEKYLEWAKPRLLKYQQISKNEVINKIYEMLDEVKD